MRRGPSAPVTTPLRTVGDLVVDVAARLATVAGQEVRLRTKEFDLLTRLSAEPGVAVSRASLMADVWDEHWSGSTKTLDVHVAAVRRKISEACKAAGARAPEIVTVRGYGYRMEAPKPDREVVPG